MSHSFDLHSKLAPTLRPRMARGLAVAALLLGAAAGAQAEAGSRICGVRAVADSHPGENVGFIMKINKGDSRTCSVALNQALGQFSQVGGTGNREGLNRIWRRVRGGTVGPFAKKRIYSSSFNQTTCEHFTWYATGRDGNLCVGMPRNRLMTYAAAYREFARR